VSYFSLMIVARAQIFLRDRKKFFDRAEFSRNRSDLTKKIR
jgi:hypothetical protein